MARPGLEPGTPRFSGLCPDPSNTKKCPHGGGFRACQNQAFDIRCLRAFDRDRVPAAARVPNPDPIGRPADRIIGSRGTAEGSPHHWRDESSSGQVGLFSAASPISPELHRAASLRTVTGM
jgi:hypothetical protein